MERASLALLSASSRPMPILRGPTITSSITRFLKIWSSGFWNTYPTLPASCATVRSEISFPPNRIVPETGLSSPFNSLTSVVFPAPF